MVVNVPVHDQVAPFLWASDETAHHGRSMWQSKTSSHFVNKPKSKQDETRDPGPLLEHEPNDLKASQKCHLLKVPQPLSSTTRGPDF